MSVVIVIIKITTVINNIVILNIAISNIIIVMTFINLHILMTLQGIITSDGSEWSDQRKFALKHLKDFGFGRAGLEGVIQVTISISISISITVTKLKG